jgi:hypothetical protein
MTSVKSSNEGNIVRSVSFVIVDKGDAVFLDCAYHELLHAFGLSNHDQRNPWTTLNQKRMVGYLTVYDRALLTLLYDPQIRPGMTAKQTRGKLPGLIQELGLAAQGKLRQQGCHKMPVHTANALGHSNNPAYFLIRLSIR